MATTTGNLHTVKVKFEDDKDAFSVYVVLLAHEFKTYNEFLQVTLDKIKEGYKKGHLPTELDEWRLTEGRDPLSQDADFRQALNRLHQIVRTSNRGILDLNLERRMHLKIQGTFSVLSDPLFFVLLRDKLPSSLSNRAPYRLSLPTK